MRERIVLILLLVAFAAGCGGEKASGKTSIVAGFYPLAYLAERIAPDTEVRNITPAGAEPHDLELSARDVERVQDADLVLYVGGGFQPALEDAAIDHPNAVDLLDTSRSDLHVWLDPTRFSGMAREIAGELARPTAAESVVADLEELDRDLRAGLADCERRELVTSHAAFAYLADAYGLEQIPLTGVSPEAEPAARELEALVAEVEQSGATTVFFEPLVSPDLAETVAREAGVETAELDPLESLTDDQLAAGDDYFSVMRANLDALRKGLGCS